MRIIIENDKDLITLSDTLSHLSYAKLPAISMCIHGAPAQVKTVKLQHLVADRTRREYSRLEITFENRETYYISIFPKRS